MIMLRAKLLSSDPPEKRAEKIVSLLGMSGDPGIIARHKSVITEILRQYREVDIEARKVNSAIGGRG